MRNKFLTVLVMALLIALMPSVVNAEELTLNDIINNANNGDVITLNKDYIEDVVVASGKNITIELNGYSITNESQNTITNNGDLTIKGTGKVLAQTKGAIVVANEYGKLTINGGSYGRVDGISNDNYIILNHGTMTINGGSIAANGGCASIIDNGWYEANKNTKAEMSTMIINGGNFKITNNNKYIKNDDFGDMTVNSGSFNMEIPSSAIIANVGFASGKEKVTINGGDFTYTGTNVAIWDYDWNTQGYKDDSTTIVNGGTFNLTSDSAKTANVELNKSEGYNQYQVVDSDDEYVVANEKDLDTKVEIKEMDESQIPTDDKSKIDEINNDSNSVIVGYYDINAYKVVNNSIKVDTIKNTDSKIKIILSLPSDIKPVEAGYTRLYILTRLHDGKIDIIEATLNSDNTVSFESDKFSTYSLSYKDVKNEVNTKTEIIKNPKTFDGILMYLSLSLISLAVLSIAEYKYKKSFN